MSNGAVVAAAAAAAIANAVKASGAIVRVSPEEFSAMLGRADNALVVHAERKFFRTTYQYLVGYKGFVFYTKSREPIPLPGRLETVRAEKIWVPD